MNSPTEKKPSDKPTLSPREMMEQAMSATVMEIIQLRRTLWLAIRQMGAPLILDETECHPLWRMQATRMPDGKIQLEALQLPEPTEEQLTALAELLNGSKTELEAAMDQGELKEYPPAYVRMRVQAKVVQREDGYWADARFAKIVDEKKPGAN